MGSFLGGKQDSSVKIPAWAEQAAQQNINRARQFEQLGYMPYYGPQVAAFTPLQQAGMQSAADMASAYGLLSPNFDAMAGVPEAQDFGCGLMGYGSGDLFEQARAEFEARNPQMAQQYNQMFTPYGTPETNPQAQQGIPYTDPQTGETRYISFPWGQSRIPFGGF